MCRKNNFFSQIFLQPIGAGEYGSMLWRWFIFHQNSQKTAQVVIYRHWYRSSTNLRYIIKSTLLSQQLLRSEVTSICQKCDIKETLSLYWKHKPNTNKWYIDYVSSSRHDHPGGGIYTVPTLEQNSTACALDDIRVEIW